MTRTEAGTRADGRFHGAAKMFTPVPGFKRRVLTMEMSVLMGYAQRSTFRPLFPDALEQSNFNYHISRGAYRHLDPRGARDTERRGENFYP